MKKPSDKVIGLFVRLGSASCAFEMRQCIDKVFQRQLVTIRRMLQDIFPCDAQILQNVPEDLSRVWMARPCHAAVFGGDDVAKQLRDMCTRLELRDAVAYPLQVNIPVSGELQEKPWEAVAPPGCKPFGYIFGIGFRKNSHRDLTFVMNSWSRVSARLLAVNDSQSGGHAV